MSSKEKILITGANGLLGRHFSSLFNKDYELYALVKNIPETPVKNVKYHTIDLSTDWHIDDLPANINIIIHLAQSEKFRDFPNEAMDMFQVNISSTAKLLDYAQKNKIRHFIYASSGGMYAQSRESFHENSPLTPTNELGYYLGSKRCSEILATNYSSLFTVSILRFFFIYGVGQKRNMLLPRLADNIRNGHPITLQGDNGLLINPIHAVDAAKAVEECLKRQDSATYNIAGDIDYSLKAIANMISETISIDPIFEYQDKEATKITADISAMKRDLYSPLNNLKDHIKDIL